MNNYKKQFGIISDVLLVCAAIIAFSSCKKYLDAKSDKQLAVPVTLADAQALLDNYAGINNSYPTSGALADDDYYLTDTYYAGTTTINQNNYIWLKETASDNDWNNMYKNIRAANLALETATAVDETPFNKADRDRIRGTALFIRGCAFYQLAQFFALPYDSSIAMTKPGIVLKLKSDVIPVNERQSMDACYRQVLADLKEAALLLPALVQQPSRPGKGAAFGALARVYLAMENYVDAGKYADSCLSINNTLLNYNSLDVNATAPFTRFNAEVIYPTTILVSSALSVTNARADTQLIQSYNINDLRKKLYFKTNGTGTGTYYTFKGSYDGTTTGSLFNGIATDEMYFIRSECFARNGNVSAAMNDLNAVLITRWKTGTFVRLTATTSNDALTTILAERRKELTFRALRWFDLRRLNKDNRFAKTLTRILNGTTYVLPPNDPRYTFYIPLAVIALNGMEQNVR